MSDAPERTTTRRPWRENLEALTMAIVVALLFKYFVLEISKIPSGSMQPTLMGNPETGVFDRTLVDKLAYHFRDPERFEIVVFKHPLERSRIMVKRLVGMPGEELKIEHGDLWTRPQKDAPWSHLRRPPKVQREMWRRLAQDPRNGAEWGVVRGGKDWRITEDALFARGDGAARFRPRAGPITDRYVDGYPPALVDRIAVRDPRSGTNPVGDVRLEGELSALAGTTAVTFELTEGQHVYEFVLPGPGAATEAAVEVRIRGSGAGERVERGERLRLTAGQRVRFALENLDDRLAFELGGRTVLAADVETSARQEASLTIAVAGEGADLLDLCLARDLYYLTPDDRPSWTVEIPARHYVMLGDNTQDSADGRLWKAKTYTYRLEDRTLVVARGNYREGGENPTFTSRSDGTPLVRFRDQWGEVHWFPREIVVSDTLPGNAALVPRELVLGRALAIFWPIRPFDDLWRVGWLH